MTNALDDYADVSTTRNIDENVHAMPAAYDEKDDMDSLKEKLQRRKKPIYAGLAFLAVVVIGVTVGVASTDSSTANTASAETGQQSQVESDAGAVQAAKDSVSSSGSAGWSSYNHSGSSSDAVAGEASAGQDWSLSTL
ncbi:unnamed protein product [Phytophthora lilii]|uniref:Unnamed protein product n=1 Tax=Phytophthora lilii TaxID=2077276 RepID=A0A9W6U512_9STRA|nr:unnamed protein product [Phytophthora lilii]